MRRPPFTFVTPQAGGGSQVSLFMEERGLRCFDPAFGERLRIGCRTEVRARDEEVRLPDHGYVRKDDRSPWYQGLAPSYLSNVTGQYLQGRTDDLTVDPVAHDVPAGYLQFFVDASSKGRPKLKRASSDRLADIHAVTHVVRGLETKAMGTALGRIQD